MDNILTGIIIGQIAGIVLGHHIVYLVTPSLLFKESKHHEVFNTTVSKVEEAVLANGWKVLHVHDLQAP